MRSSCRDYEGFLPSPRSFATLTAASRLRLCRVMFGKPAVDAEPLARLPPLPPSAEIFHQHQIALGLIDLRVQHEPAVGGNR